MHVQTWFAELLDLIGKAVVICGIVVAKFEGLSKSLGEQPCVLQALNT